MPPVTNKKKKEARLGQSNYNKQNSLMKIVEYNKADDIIVEFQDQFKFKVRTKYGHFSDGNVRNPYVKDIYGVGYIGNTCTSLNNECKKSFDTWQSMLQRCYDVEHYQRTQPTYKDKYVCDEWLCFATFEKWFNNNYYEISNEKMALDKDILLKGNKKYCPEYCCFVPQRINNLFTKCDAWRGNLPIGVQQRGNRYIVQFHMGDKTYTYQSFDTPERAFEHYKTMKEKYIKIVAEQYKGMIPDKLYEALLRYEVEITD